MAFRSWNNQHLAKFNSADSSEFLDLYEDARDAKILSEYDKPSNKNFAPSSFRCRRIQWFRLRGVQPDRPETADAVLDFTATVGTALHRMIQEILQYKLGDAWVDVGMYIEQNVPNSALYTTTSSEDSLETLVTLSDPPVRFACDGIINWKGENILLEIKSSEFSSWSDLTDPKPQHIDQTKCYCALLNLNRVFFFYIDRQYGGVKCYDISYPSDNRDTILHEMKEIQDLAEYHICPDSLPKGDSWCTASHCKYYKKCAEYGR